MTLQQLLVAPHNLMVGQAGVEQRQLYHRLEQVQTVTSRSYSQDWNVHLEGSELTDIGFFSVFQVLLSLLVFVQDRRWLRHDAVSLLSLLPQPRIHRQTTGPEGVSGTQS